jgi:hypothetical protein
MEISMELCNLIASLKKRMIKLGSSLIKNISKSYKQFSLANED